MSRNGTGPMGRDGTGPKGRDGTGPGGGAGEGGVTPPLLQVLQVAPCVLKNTMDITIRKQSMPPPPSPTPITDRNIQSALLLVACCSKGARCTLQRQNTEISKQIIPEKEYRGPSPNFHIHASVSDLYIPTIVLPILLEEICRPILGLYKSLTELTGLWPRYSQKRNT
jgi:hypothetical protein